MNKANPKAARPRVPVAQSELEMHLDRQLRLLDKSCRDFDDGDANEAGRIATIIRILAYDCRQSRSLLTLLNMKAIDFQAYGSPVNENNLLGDMSLVMGMMTSDGASYVPCLNKGPFRVRSLSFDTWWNEDVIRLPDNTRLSRGQTVLMMTNQDGGAHVDPEIDEIYHRVAKANELGFSWSNGKSSKEIFGVERATVRQIAFEISGSIRVEVNRRAGNKLCSCGSGRKHRYCHGKKQ